MLFISFIRFRVNSSFLSRNRTESLRVQEKQTQLKRLIQPNPTPIIRIGCTPPTASALLTSPRQPIVLKRMGVRF